MYFYEIKCCCEHDELYRYFYTTSKYAIRGKKDLKGKIPNKILTLMDDRYLYPMQIRVMNGFEYLYCKYYKTYYKDGEKIKWEKEDL